MGNIIKGNLIVYDIQVGDFGPTGNASAPYATGGKEKEVGPSSWWWVTYPEMWANHPEYLEAESWGKLYGKHLHYTQGEISLGEKSRLLPGVSWITGPGTAVMISEWRELFADLFWASRGNSVLPFKKEFCNSCSVFLNSLTGAEVEAQLAPRGHCYLVVGIQDFL